MKVTKAYELLAKLRCLSLVGQDFLGELEWVGTVEDWNRVDKESAAILRDWDIKKLLNN